MFAVGWTVASRTPVGRPAASSSPAHVVADRGVGGAGTATACQALVSYVRGYVFSPSFSGAIADCSLDPHPVSARLPPIVRTTSGRSVNLMPPAYEVENTSGASVGHDQVTSRTVRTHSTTTHAARSTRGAARDKGVAAAGQRA